MNETVIGELSSLHKELGKVHLNDDSEEEMHQLSILRRIFCKMRDALYPALADKVSHELDVESETDIKIIYDYLEREFSGLLEFLKNPTKEIGIQEIAAVISDKTGIPLGKLQSKEKERLLNMENMLRKRVVGQDHALKSLTDAILESRSGLNKPGQPIGSFFFLGPTGTPVKQNLQRL